MKTEGNVDEGGKPMYIRVKRKKVTIFLQTHSKETIASITEKLASLLEKGEEEMKLWNGSVVLDGNRTLEHYGIENEAVIGLAYRLDTGEFEQVSIETVES